MADLLPSFLDISQLFNSGHHGRKPEEKKAYPNRRSSLLAKEAKTTRKPT
jgi:hypothetical protein